MYTVSPFTDFWTPSRNIGCLAVLPGQGLDPALITCYIGSGLRPSPARRPSECRGAVFGWGQIVWLWSPQSGTASGLSGYGCADYEPIDTSAPTLDYSRRIQVFGITCNSKPIGLRCSNEQGPGSQSVATAAPTPD